MAEDLTAERERRWSNALEISSPTYLYAQENESDGSPGEREIYGVGVSTFLIIKKSDFKYPSILSRSILSRAVPGRGKTQRKTHQRENSSGDRAS